MVAELYTLALESEC